MKIKFAQDHVVDDFRKGTDAEESYKAGKIYNIKTEASVVHFVRRGLAVPADRPAKEAAGGVEMSPQPVAREADAPEDDAPAGVTSSKG